MIDVRAKDVIIIGTGRGKTTLAQEIAKKYGHVYVDAQATIANALNGKCTGWHIIDNIYTVREFHQWLKYHGDHAIVLGLRDPKWTMPQRTRGPDALLRIAKSLLDEGQLMPLSYYEFEVDGWTDSKRGALRDRLGL